MSDLVEPTTRPRRTVFIVRLAGGLLVLLGLANVVLAWIAASSARIRLSDGTTVALGLLGLLTVVLGVLVATGRRWALVASLIVFGGLFVVQAFAATGGGAPAPALVTLALVVFPLVLAVRATRQDR